MGLTAEAVVASGARLAREAGVDAIGVRAVAGRLSVTPMALYRHVPSAATLKAAVIESLVSELPTVADAGPWEERARSWAVEARAVLAAAPGLAHHVLQHWAGLVPTLRAVEHLGRMFEAVGPAGTDAVAAANTVFTYVVMRVQAEEAVRTHGVARDLRRLGAHRRHFPFLWAHRAEYATARLDEHFAYGLEVILAGLAASPSRTGDPRADP